MNPFKALFAILFGVATSVAVAQMPLAEPRHRPDVAALLNLDAERAAQVNAIFDLAHEKIRSAHEQVGPPVDETARAVMHAAMEAIRADTEEKLAAVLTAEELAKLQAALPPPRMQPMLFRRG